MLQFIEEILSTTHKKQSRIFYNDLNTNIIKFHKNQHPSLWSEFVLSRSEFIKRFGTTPKTREELEKYVFIKNKRGYLGFDGNKKSEYNNYSWRQEVLSELVEMSSSDATKRASKLNIINKKNTNIVDHETGIKNHMNNNLELVYTDDDNGRHHNAFQNVPSKLRPHFFPGWYSYDIDASAPTILHQIYMNTGGTSLSGITNYINKKDLLREEWADKVGCTIKEMKSTITSMFFGGIIPSEKQLYIKDVTFSISKVLTTTQIKKLLRTESFMEVRDDTKLMMKTISDYYRHDNNLLTNGAGYTKHFERWESRKVCYHLYVGVEASILSMLMSYFLSHNMVLTVLHLHDGFLTTNDIEPILLSQLVKQQTGFSVTYSKEAL
jgi:hypothetical protein